MGIWPFFVFSGTDKYSKMKKRILLISLAVISLYTSSAGQVNMRKTSEKIAKKDEKREWKENRKLQKSDKKKDKKLERQLNEPSK